MTALRGIAVDEGIVIAASSWGKYKSAILCPVATVALLLHYPFFWCAMEDDRLVVDGCHRSSSHWSSGFHYTVWFP